MYLLYYQVNISFHLSFCAFSKTVLVTLSFKNTRQRIRGIVTVLEAVGYSTFLQRSGPYIPWQLYSKSHLEVTPAEPRHVIRTEANHSGYPNT